MAESKSMKITIEGHDTEPIVHENVEMYSLITKKSGNMGGGFYGDLVFSGYAAARVQSAFTEHVAETSKEES